MSTTTDVPTSITTPDTVQTSIGTLEFRDGAPSADTAARLYDNLDFMRGVEAFLSTFQGASTVAIRQGFLDVGVEDNQVLIFPELMDSASLFLTANSDTVYFLSFVDLTSGPMVIDVPVLPAGSAILGTIDDMWFQWVTDFGLPGPDRGAGGRYLVVGPGYDGPLPDSGFHVSHARTTRVCVLGRAFMVDNEPAPAVEAIKAGFRIAPYTPGAAGTAVGSFLAGRAPMAAPAAKPETRFVEAVHLAVNTIPPNDFAYWETIDELVQQEPAGAGDPEILGQLASVGIRKGQRFAPDERMRAILEDAVAVGNATARTLFFAARESEGFAYYEGSAWFNGLWVGGYEFLTPPPAITADGVQQHPSDGARKLNSRIAFLYPATGVTPAMCMRLTGIGSQYLIASRDAGGEFLDGGQNYRLSLPADIPESRFWSVMLYDRQTRSMTAASCWISTTSTRRCPGPWDCKNVAKAGKKNSLKAFDRLARVVDGEPRIVSDPPLLVPARELVSKHQLEELEDRIAELLGRYRESLKGDRRHLFDSCLPPGSAAAHALPRVRSRFPSAGGPWRRAP